MILHDSAREKLINAIFYFCRHTKKLNETKLYKLLYFLDFIHFKKVGRPVTDLEYYAWDFGPVPRKLFFEIKNKTAPREILNCIREDIDSLTGEKKATFFKTLQKPDLEVFSEREREVLENVAFIFKDASATEMKDITHLENEPWDQTLKTKGSEEKIDYMLALDSGANISEELAVEREKLSKEMKMLFGLNE